MSPDPHDPTAARGDPDARGHGPDARGPRRAARGGAVPAGAVSGGAVGRQSIRASLEALDAALRASRVRYYAGDATPEAALEAAVCAVVHALRSEGWPVLATLRAVKARLEAPDGAAGRVPPPVADAAVRWCIAHYFDDPGPPPAPDRGA